MCTAVLNQSLSESKVKGEIPGGGPVPSDLALTVYGLLRPDKAFLATVSEAHGW